MNGQRLQNQRRRLSIKAMPPGDGKIIRGADILDKYAPPVTLATPYRDACADVEPNLAQDVALDRCHLDAFLRAVNMSGMPTFLGYGTLSNLTQEGLVRAAVETTADEMTRKFFELENRGDEERTADLEVLRGELERLNVRKVFNHAAALCGYFGGCLVYLDTGTTDPAELMTPLTVDSAKIGRGMLRRLTVVEPVSLAPGAYNSLNPLNKEYFKPTFWYTQAQRVHASRFLYFAANTPPLLLKSAYNFFGIPDAQMAVDYIADFAGTREAAARLLRKFSLTALKTNMDSLLYGSETGDGDVQRRLEFFARHRDNNGVFALDFETEELIQINTPLSGVDTIVRQALELLAAIWRIPAVKLLGISPSGFNATGDADMRNFYDFIASKQAKVFDPPLKHLLRILQLSALGTVVSGITHAWVPLWEMTAREQAEIRKMHAETDQIYLNGGCISQEEVRQRLSAEPSSGYGGIDAADIPDPPDDGLVPKTGTSGGGW